MNIIYPNVSKISIPGMSDVAKIRKIDGTSSGTIIWQKGTVGGALMFTADGPQTITLHGITSNCYFEYSTDGEHYTEWVIPPTFILEPLYFGNGTTLYLRGLCPHGITQSSTTMTYFEFSNSVDTYCTGNIMHLIDYTKNLKVIPTDYCFTGLFANCTCLKSAPELPATGLKYYCYNDLFYNCTGLETPPSILPAGTVPKNAYERMFYGCSSLVTAPEINASYLSESCCAQMFRGCSNLIVAPDINANSVEKGACSYMFASCTSLTKVPMLKPSFINIESYYNMFNGCFNLNDVTCLATDISQTRCITDWLKNVSSNGVFKKKSTVVYPIGPSGIPTGWTIQNI